MGLMKMLKDRRDNKPSKCRNCGKEVLQKDLKIILIDGLATEACPDCVDKEFNKRFYDSISEGD